MPFVVLAVLLIVLIFLPGLWVQRVMKRYQNPVDRYQGTGGELARHLLDLLDLQKVRVEPTESGDHYDPTEKVVRLTAGNYEGRSLTAITVAAHEVGHAIQDASAYPPLRIRTRLVGATRHLERLGAAVLMISPFVGLLTRAPTVAALTFLGGFLALGTAAVVHVVTLPVELDASFARALPLLEKGHYLKPEDRPHARKILKAAAMTYVAASLMSLLNVARWWALLRR